MTKSSTKKIPIRGKLNRIDMTCKNCNRVVRGVGHDVVAVTCRWCVISVTNNDADKKSKNNFPRGWHFKKEFISEDGRVFHRGVEQKRNSND